MNGLSVSTITGGRTGGPFMFFTGVISLLTSAVLTSREVSKQEIANQEYWKQNYNTNIQLNQYDCNRPYLFDRYDYQKVMDEILNEYPNMSELNRFQIAVIAIAKRLMEEETSYNYKVPEQYVFLGDIERFANDNSRIK